MATLFEKLTLAGLPILAATEDGAITGIPGMQMTIEQSKIFQDIIQEHFRSAEYAKGLITRARKENARSKLNLAGGFESTSTGAVIAHIRANSGNVPDMREEVIKLAVLVCALLDEVMPDR